MRRFSFSIHFQPFDTTQRIQLWKNILQDQRVGGYLTDAQVSDLARHDVSPGVIEQAVRKAIETGSCGEDLYGVVTLALESYETLLRGGQKLKGRTAVDESFTIEGLNVIGTDVIQTRRPVFLRISDPTTKPLKNRGVLIDLEVSTYSAPESTRGGLVK